MNDVTIINDKGVGIGPCIDTIYSDGYVYAVSSDGTLNIFEENADGTLVKISSLNKIGNLRQIEISGAFVYITAREDGVFIIDISNPKKPHIACHWDSIEFATGIAISGKLAAVCNRILGVELLDISVPTQPRHISLLRAGEVQSVYIANGLLFTGSWGEREVVIYDIHNAQEPKFLGKAKLDGRGDGICVHNGLLYAATGHHSSKVAKSLAKPQDVGYGEGNGLEIFDISNPAVPTLLSRTKLVDKYYFCNFDMWNVSVSYPYAYVNNSFNGLFVFDISNPTKPMLLERFVIEISPDIGYFQEIITDKMLESRPPVIPFDYNKEMYSPVCGVAISNDVAYVAGGLSDLHTIHSNYFKRTVDKESKAVPICDYYDSNPGIGTEDCVILRTRGQARAAVWNGEYFYIACGNGGISVYADDIPQYLKEIHTKGIAMDVCFNGDKMYVAEGNEGLSIWRNDEVIGRFNYHNLTISQVVVSANGKHAILQCDCSKVLIVNIAEPERPELEIEDVDFPGLLYERQISPSGLDGKFYTCHWNCNTNHWYDLSGYMASKLPDRHYNLNCCGNETHMAAIDWGTYRVLDASLNSSESIRIEKLPDDGRAVLFGDRFFVSSRAYGAFAVYDVSDIYSPMLLKYMNFSGSPALAAYNGRVAAIPVGYQGVAFLKI